MLRKTFRQGLRRCGLAAGLAVVAGAAQPEVTLSGATQDAMLHVLAHEIGHAMLREFDLPILGPEEDIADDFATIYVFLLLPDRAADIVAARARQTLADGDTPGMFSAYRADDQRAGRAICLLYGQDPARFDALATEFGLAGEAAADCRDAATEVGRSWRRIIAQYRMPEGARVTEVGLDVAETPFAQALAASDSAEEAYRLLSGIDWHSRITLALEDCDGTAGWACNGRRITICEAYIARFEAQLGGGAQ